MLPPEVGTTNSPPSRLMRRVHQVLLIVTFLAFSWLAMMAVHELGHVIGAICTGATVEKVVLHPLAISRTEVGNNRNPLVVIWSGPVIGSLLPLVMLFVFQQAKWTCRPLAKFFAGFCLATNGAYIGCGSIERIGDAGDLLNHGSPTWTLWLFGVVTIPFGFWLWNGLGPSFGLGTAKGAVNRQLTYLSAGLLALTVLVELCFSPSH